MDRTRTARDRNSYRTTHERENSANYHKTILLLERPAEIRHSLNQTSVLSSLTDTWMRYSQCCLCAVAVKACDENQEA